MKDQPCAYCGGPGGTRDHVFPVALFTRPLPPDLITVPACRACQDRKSGGEGDLRDYIATHFRAAQHPNALGLQLKVERAIAGNYSQLPPGAVGGHVQGVMIRQRSPAGLVLPDLVAVPFHFGPMYLTVEMVVRGLYAHTFGAPASPDLPVEVTRIREVDSAGFRSQFEANVPSGAWSQRGNGVVAWLCGLEQETNSAVFTLVFHHAIAWSAIVGEGALIMRKLREDAEADIARAGRLGLMTHDFSPPSPVLNVTLTSLTPSRGQRQRPSTPPPLRTSGKHRRKGDR